MIGYFGDIVFSTSSEKILSFRDFKLNSSANWGEHKQMGLKPEWEFLGANAEKVSFEIVLDINFGIDPRKEIEKLVSYAENGIVNVLVIGGKRIGNKWKITSVSSMWKCIASNGKLIKASVSLAIEEYQ